MSKQTNAAVSINVESVRAEFPLLSKKVRGKSLVYLDNAASSLTPDCVLEAIESYYRDYRANIHRGVHFLSQKATDLYEQSRTQVKEFIGASSTKEIIFLRGTTEAINLVAQTYGRSQLEQGDEVILSAMEHHSNIVPWQILRDQLGIKLRIIPMDNKANLDLEAYAKLFNDRTKLVATVHVSNALGTVNPIKKMASIAHQHGVPILVDGAQATPHMPVDVTDLDVDFYAFSSHKVFGPTGVGVLYGKQELLEAMPPYQGGGDMILSVSFDKTEYNTLPHKFEAGTPNIAGVIGLGAAISFINRVGFQAIMAQEAQLFDYAKQQLSEIDALQFIGEADHQAGVISFLLKDIHPHDIGTILDQQGIAIRAGHHCAQPVMEFFGVPATGRASFAFYNTLSEVDMLVDGLKEVVRMFA